MPSGGILHLFVVMTNVCANNMHLLLSISTIKPNRHYDSTCQLSIADHAWIKAPSYVAYRFPEQRTVQAIEKMSSEWRLHPERRLP
jgi:hypothetical protein